MKLPPEQSDEASLLRLGEEAVSLLEKRDFQSLAERVDYALKFGRSPVVAIEGDFQACLSEFHSLPEQPPTVLPSVRVNWFKPNSSNLVAAVECVFTTAEGCPILVELIVTSSGKEKHITLEDLSLAV
ncbi:MAG TPA: hypothetical protein VF585_07560 [Chthoniobacterales bacterium]|jgi:hypothetical protein